MKSKVIVILHSFIILLGPSLSGLPRRDALWNPTLNMTRLSEFVDLFRRRGVLPLPEDGHNMLIAGGPPCQDVSDTY